MHWQATEVTRESRAELMGQRPMVLWFTGLSGAGKSTIANLVEKRLHALGRRSFLLDGDNVRHGLNKDLGFTDVDRVENLRRVAEVARLMTDAGLIVISAFISPFRAERVMVRATMLPGEYLEIFVDTPLAEAERRDVKGAVRQGPGGPAAALHGHRLRVRATGVSRHPDRHDRHGRRRGRRADRPAHPRGGGAVSPETDAALAGRLAAAAGQVLLTVRCSGPFEGKALGEVVPSSIELRWRSGEHQAALTV